MSKTITTTKLESGNIITAFESYTSLHTKKYRVVEVRGDIVIVETLNSLSQRRLRLCEIHLITPIR